MAIRESWVPGVRLREWQPVYRIVGDPRPFRTFTSREAAERVEAELAERKRLADGGEACDGRA